MAKEGAVFTCWYGQASCTAGRASFMTGRIPIRSALSIVVFPRMIAGHRHPRHDQHQRGEREQEDAQRNAQRAGRPVRHRDGCGQPRGAQRHEAGGRAAVPGEEGEQAAQRLGVATIHRERIAVDQSPQLELVGDQHFVAWRA